MRRLMWAVVCVSVAALSACAGPGASPAAPDPTAAASTASVTGQQLSVSPSQLFVGCFFPTTGTITASTNFAGPITATVAGDGRCSVSASQDATVTPGGGGMKSATFTVTVTDFGRCTVTLTDKKGSVATVPVFIEASGSCFI